MKQLILHLGNGRTQLEEVPAPQVQDGCLLIQNTRSLISLGTERMLVSFGKGSWLSKARQQPDRVQQVFSKIKTDGLRPTVTSVFNKLAQPIPLGYSSAGIVIGVGDGVTGYKIGDRVASNGSHAEVVSVPQNLAAKIPDGVSDDAAAFTVIGAIALQGIRLLNVTFGETVVVIGMGLIGHIAAQLLTAAGCRVIAMDTDDAKLAIATASGISVINRNDNPLEYVQHATGGIGADAVLITAATDSNEPISTAARISRKRGRIVLTGVVGLELKRDEFYEKELSFQVSCSYGPGRYDAEYEQGGNDYPAGYVRWTEQRNFEAVLHAMQTKQLRLESLITRSLPLEAYASAYENMDANSDIATLFRYPEAATKSNNSSITLKQGTVSVGHNAIGIIGAGSFTTGVVLPALQQAKATISQIASNNGLSATMLAKKYGIPIATTNYQNILNDKDTSLVIIATRHSQHAAMVVEAMQAGKHVFVEKPLALNEAELQQVLDAQQQSGKMLQIGFNRRHAPMAAKMRDLLGSNQVPVNIVATINAGQLPAKSWLSRKEEGGRIIGEVCHFIDLCSFLAASAVAEVCASGNPGSDDDCMLLLRFANGSQATINYLTGGDKGHDKERIEVYSSGHTLILQNWRKLTGHGFKAFSSMSGQQDKGHSKQFEKLVGLLQGNGAQLISLTSIVNTTRATFAAVESLKTNQWENVIY